MSTLNVDKVDPSTGTALEIGSSGDTITIPSGATLDISASTLTPPATMPASSGVNLTSLNATNLGSGTVPTARLGSGTASSSTVLYGDQTYKAEPGGGIINQIVQDLDTSYVETTSTTFGDTGAEATITLSDASSNLLVNINYAGMTAGSSVRIQMKYLVSVDGGAFSDQRVITQILCGNGQENGIIAFREILSPGTTDPLTYKVQWKLTSSASMWKNNYGDAANNTLSGIWLTEILT